LCLSSFNETRMFEETDKLGLKKEMQQKFRNISLIMDCVSCETCKVHAKLQIMGIGAALKILLTPNDAIQLDRNEVIALFNTLHKFSESISALEKMKIEARWKPYEIGIRGGGVIFGVLLILYSLLTIIFAIFYTFRN